MVQVMETWFLADRAALQEYFGTKFKANKIKNWPRLENVKKCQVFKVLNTATALCKKNIPRVKSHLSCLPMSTLSSSKPHARMQKRFLKS